MPNEIVPRLDLPALVPATGGAVVCAVDGSCARARIDEARHLFRSGNVIVAHAAFVAGRLKTNPAAALFDVLETVRVRAAGTALRTERAGTRALSRTRHPTHAGGVRARVARGGGASARRTRAP
ncbi:MAG: hypothetical protein WDM89_10350 [Rhizomicrobium sp.]